MKRHHNKFWCEDRFYCKRCLWRIIVYTIWRNFICCIIIIALNIRLGIITPIIPKCSIIPYIINPIDIIPLEDRVIFKNINKNFIIIRINRVNAVIIIGDIIMICFLNEYTNGIIINNIICYVIVITIKQLNAIKSVTINCLYIIKNQIIITIEKKNPAFVIRIYRISCYDDI